MAHIQSSIFGPIQTPNLGTQEPHPKDNGDKCSLHVI